MTTPPESKWPVLTAALPADALEEVNRLWTIVRAFSNTAHDVNNALQVVSGSAELLAARDADPVVQRRAAAIRVQAGRAAETIERLLAYSCEDAGDARPVELSALVDAAVAMRAFTLQRTRIGIEVERAGTAPHLVAADRRKTLQLLLNLLLCGEEAIAAMDDRRIHVHLRRQGHSVSVIVTTTGKPPREGGRASLADAPKAAAVAKGSQLLIAARLARSQGGTLDVADEEDRLTLTLTFETSQ